MENTDQNTQKKEPVNPGCWMTFIFTAIMWIFVLDTLGIFSGDRYLLIGCIMLITLPVWIKGADLYYKSGNAVMGHFYMVFGVMFAGMVAAAYIVLYFSRIFPALSMDERFLGVIYLVGGVFLLPTLPSYLYMSKVDLITWTSATIWLLIGGLYYFIPTSMLLYSINAVLCCVVAAGVTYMMLGEAYQMSCGKNLPMGKPLRKQI